MGALDTTADDDTDTGDDLDFSGSSKGALQTLVSRANDTSDLQGALDKVTQSLKANRNLQQAQMLASLAGAIGAPTRTGSIGEVASNVGNTLAPILGQQQASEQKNASDAAKLQLGEAEKTMASRRALGVAALKAMGQQSPQQKEAGKIVLGAPDAQGRQNAFRKVLGADGNLTYQQIRILQPGETSSAPVDPNAVAGGKVGAPAPMMDEGDLANLSPTGAPTTIAGQPVAAPAPTSLSSAAPDAIPGRPVDANAPIQDAVTGLPADLEKNLNLKATRQIDLSSFDPAVPVTVNLRSGTVEVHTPKPPSDPLAQYNGLTGSALMQALSPNDKAEVQAILDGRILAPTTGTRAKEGSRLLALATAADPTFDAGVAKAKFATRLAFASGGKLGQNFASIDTVMNHLSHLNDTFQDINNTDSPDINAAKNFVSAHTGHASPNNTRQAAIAAANEMMRTFRGNTGGSTKDVSDWEKTIPINGSPAQQQGSIQGGLTLVTGRLQPLVNQWNTTMGQNRSILSFLSPGARTSWMKLDPNFQLTDDDKAYLSQQELAARTKKVGQPAQPVAPVAAPTAPVVQPNAAVRPAGMNDDALIAAARQSMKGGKSGPALAAQLRQWNVDPARVANFQAWTLNQ